MISVIVIGKDEGEGISRCLQSVRAALEGALPYEMIYVDSHSQDDSLTRAALCRTMRARRPRWGDGSARRPRWARRCSSSMAT